MLVYFDLIFSVSVNLRYTSFKNNKNTIPIILLLPYSLERAPGGAHLKVKSAFEGKRSFEGALIY